MKLMIGKLAWAIQARIWGLTLLVIITMAMGCAHARMRRATNAELVRCQAALRAAFEAEDGAAFEAERERCHDNLDAIGVRYLGDVR